MFINIREPMLYPRARPDMDQIPFPIMAFLKYDGVRAFISAAGPLSRTMKLPPNRQLQQLLSNVEMAGMDGEITVGSPCAPTTLETSSAYWRTADATSEEVLFHVFDHLDYDEGCLEVYEERLLRAEFLVEELNLPFVRKAEWKWVENAEQLAAYEQEAIERGYEGLILRHPGGRYKPGRCTINEAIGFKLKQFIDDEAVITGFEELMTNNNPEYTDETGKTKRSTMSEGMLPGGTLGAILGHHPKFGDMRVGSGFSAEQRALIWSQREHLLGKLMTFKYMPHGSNTGMRHTVFRAIRADLEQ
jgi:DNA ligase-1